MADPYNELQQDAQKMREDLSEAAQQVKADAQFYAEYAAETAKDKFRQSRRVAEAKAAEVDAYAQDHVWIVAGVAAVIGMLIGVLLGKDHRD